MNPYQAGQQLGTLLFGQQPNTRNPDGSPSLYDAVTGNAGHGMPYYRTLTAGATAQNVMQEARLNRAKALIAEQQQAARGRYLSDFQGAGLGDMAQLAADAGLGAGSSNPSQLLGLLAQARASQAANKADDAAMNRNIAVFAGKPLALSTTNGGITTVNPYTAPAVAPNALGDAAIAANQALVGERDAHAGLYKMQTTNPEKFHTGRGGRVADDGAQGGAPSEAFVLNGLRKRIASGQITPAQAAKFAASRGYSAVAKKLYPDYALDLGDDGNQ